MPSPLVTLAQIYAVDALDRAAHRRRDPGWLAAARTAPTSRVVLLSELRFALLGTTVAPGFDYADYETGEREALLASHPDARDLIVALTPEGERPGPP